MRDVIAFQGLGCRHIPSLTPSPAYGPVSTDPCDGQSIIDWIDMQTDAGVDPTTIIDALFNSLSPGVVRDA